ncbi:MAG: antibiotic biosynthesis monooxygenase [Betaproteobacteria bacterium]|jgi:quinol monooxygenase YgiN|nr:antibiotic biosynthesis monooxygenase [Betaproteobacteria bacterium]MCC7217966.1 antibiotic biosynthesis monooxygenase [Burkholderiales bacterium]
MYVVTVEFEIEPQQWARFLPLVLDNAQRSLAGEPGCRQFDVCVDASRPGVAFLYELYDDRAAFDAHLASPHFKAFAAATEAMIDAKRVATWQRAAP